MLMQIIRDSRDNYSEEVYDLMRSHGFYDCAAAYRTHPIKFPDKKELLKIWRNFTKTGAFHAIKGIKKAQRR